jgi:hypothetical protein
MCELKTLTVRWNDVETTRILYNPETLQSVAATDYVEGTVTGCRATEDYNIKELVARNGVPEDIHSVLNDAMEATDVETLRVRYCTNPECSYPFNWNTQKRCEYCGGNLPTDDEVESYGVEATLNLTVKKDWSLIRKALALVEEGKIAPFVYKYGHSRAIYFGWAGPKPFNRKAHSFRGRANFELLTSFGRVDLPQEIILPDGGKGQAQAYSDRKLSEALLRFIDKYGEQLMESTKVELDPERTDAMRSEYITNSWINGVYHDTHSGNNLSPREYFLSRFFNVTPMNEEVVNEALWDIYVALIEKADTTIVVRKNGAVEWRFTTIEEAWDDDVVASILVGKYGASSALAATARKVEDEDE